MSLTITGSIFVNAAPDKVWAALHDIERIALCVPGCRNLAHDGRDTYELVAWVGLGPMRVAFDGTIRVAAAERPGRLRLVGRGGGGLAGVATGTADITLVASRCGCRMAYTLMAEPKGAISSLGPVLLAGVARGLASSFAERFAQTFAPPEAPGQSVAAASVRSVRDPMSRLGNSCSTIGTR